MGKTAYTLIVAFLILLISFFAFGAQEIFPTGEQVLVKRAMEKQAPQKTTKQTINLGTMKPGIVVVGNKKLLQQAARDPLQQTLDTQFRKPRRSVV